MTQQLWEMIPPDSAVVLFFACGDGSGIDSLCQQYPQMNVIGVELDSDLRSSAIQNGSTVLADAATALQYMETRRVLADAWILDQTAWADESLTTVCRSRLFACLRPGATVVWKIPNDQYWEHLLCLITGKPDTFTRRNVKMTICELQQAGLKDIETVERVVQHGKEFEHFRKMLFPLAEALRLPQDEWEQSVQTAAIIVRSRYLSTRRDRLAIHAAVGEKQVCSRVRIEEPLSFLKTLSGISCASFDSLANAVFPKRDRLVWIWQRMLFPRAQMIAVQTRLLNNYKALTIQEWDDDPLHWEKHFLQSEFVELRSAHAIQTSTPALAEYLKQFNSEVHVFPNCMASVPPLNFSADPIVTLFFGALNRKKDWEPIMPALNKVLQAHRGRVRVKVVLDREFFDAVTCPDKVFVPFCPYPQYQELLRQSDVALLPLLPTRFNQMKSDLKFVESAACGTVALASPTVYAATIEHEKTGWLYESEEEFEHGLAQLLTDSRLRQRLAQNAWHWVRENRLLSLHYRKRLDWYEALFDRYNELTRMIGERIPELRGCGR